MEPEEIDKLFKNRLANVPATPSPDAWMRLQQKMEPPKKERTMWVYYAAASITILLLSGVLFFRQLPSDNTSQVAQMELKEKGSEINEKIFKPQATPAPNLASTSETKEINDPGKEVVKDENKEKATYSYPAASSNPGKITLAEAKVKAPVKKIMAAKELPEVKTTEEVVPSLAGTTAPVLPEATVKNTFTINNTPSANANVVQVVVKLGNETDEEEEDNLRESLSRKGALLKNIYLQARNLKNGEPVELASLGVDTEKINSEKENIKQKINKVISF